MKSLELTKNNRVRKSRKKAIGTYVASTVKKIKVFANGAVITCRPESFKVWKKNFPDAIILE